MYVLTTAMEKYNASGVEPFSLLASLWPQPQCGRSMPTFAGREDRGKHTRRCRRQATHRILAPLGGNGLFLSAG